MAKTVQNKRCKRWEKLEELDDLSLFKHLHFEIRGWPQRAVQLPRIEPRTMPLKLTPKEVNYCLNNASCSYILGVNVSPKNVKSSKYSTQNAPVDCFKYNCFKSELTSHKAFVLKMPLASFRNDYNQGKREKGLILVGIIIKLKMKNTMNMILKLIICTNKQY